MKGKCYGRSSSEAGAACRFLGGRWADLRRFLGFQLSEAFLAEKSIPLARSSTLSQTYGTEEKEENRPPARSTNRLAHRIRPKRQSAQIAHTRMLDIFRLGGFPALHRHRRPPTRHGQFDNGHLFARPELLGPEKHAFLFQPPAIGLFRAA